MRDGRAIGLIRFYRDRRFCFEKKEDMIDYSDPSPNKAKKLHGTHRSFTVTRGISLVAVDWGLAVEEGHEDVLFAVGAEA